MPVARARSACVHFSSPSFLDSKILINVADNAVFGPEDTAAVKETQQRAGLEANGVVDRPTWAALRAQSHTACDSCTEEG